MSFNFSHFVANTAVDIAKTRSTVNYIQRTFESAQRMQYATARVLNPPEVTTNAIPHSSDGKFVYSIIADRNGYNNYVATIDIVEWITDSSVPSPALHVKRTTPYPANSGCAYVTVGDLLVGNVVPGQNYTISLWFKGNKQSSSIIAQIRFYFYDSNHKLIPTGNIGGYVTFPISFTDNWQRYVFTFTAPDGAYTIKTFQVGLENINLNDTYEFYIAGLQLEQKEYATSYCRNVCIDDTRAVVQSITFKRSAGASDASDYWTDLTVSGTALKSGTITLLNSASNIMVDFYSPAGLLLASNHANVPVIPNFNDKAWEYYKVRYITMLNNDYFPITAVRKVSPYFEAPYVTDFTDSSRYTFSLPLDTTKKVGSLAVTYTSNSNIVNSNATASVINANMNAFSSYLGIPAKKSAQITITPNPTASPFEAFPFNWVVTLTDKLTNTPITRATVYAYDINGHFNLYITDEDGSFRIGDYSGFANTGIIFYYPGYETYAPATARH